MCKLQLALEQLRASCTSSQPHGTRKQHHLAASCRPAEGTTPGDQETNSAWRLHGRITQAAHVCGPPHQVLPHIKHAVPLQTQAVRLVPLVHQRLDVLACGADSEAGAGS